MAKRKQATMQEWEEMGETVKQLRRQIFHLKNLMNGKTKKGAQSKVTFLSIRLNRLCSDLENEMFRQHPNEANINVFYEE